MMPLRRLVLVLALTVVVTPALGQEKKHAIVVPTELGGFWSQRSEWKYEYNRTLENRLRSARFEVVRDALTPTESACRAVDCLVAIASAHGVDVVVAARAINNEQRLTSYGLRVIVVERTGSAAPVGRAREKKCENCTETGVRDALTTLLSATLANEPESPAVVEPAKTPDVVVTKPEPVQPAPLAPRLVEVDRFTPRQRWTMRGIGFGLLALGALGLGEGFAEVAHDGDHVVRNGLTYRESTGKGEAVFFSLGSVLAVGGGALVAAGWWPAKKTITVAPEVSQTGARLSVQGKF